MICCHSQICEHSSCQSVWMEKLNIMHIFSFHSTSCNRQKTSDEDAEPVGESIRVESRAAKTAHLLALVLSPKAHSRRFPPFAFPAPCFCVFLCSCATREQTATKEEEVQLDVDESNIVTGKRQRKKVDYSVRVNTSPPPGKQTLRKKVP